MVCSKQAIGRTDKQQEREREDRERREDTEREDRERREREKVLTGHGTVSRQLTFHFKARANFLKFYVFRTRLLVHMVPITVCITYTNHISLCK